MVVVIFSGPGRMVVVICSGPGRLLGRSSGILERNSGPGRMVVVICSGPGRLLGRSTENPRARRGSATERPGPEASEASEASEGPCANLSIDVLAWTRSYTAACEVDP
jgi:hypothetical protein